MLRTCTDIETQPPERTAVLVQERCAEADEAAILLLKIRRGRIESQTGFGTAQGKPRRRVLERHGPGQHLHFIQGNTRSDPRPSLATTFKRPPDADAGVPDHHVTFNAQSWIAQRDLQLRFSCVEGVLTGLEFG